MKKKALIFGVTGQDGSYLAKFLLKKNYIVHGVRRRSSSFNTKRIDDIYIDPLNKNANFFLHYGDLTDSLSIFKLIDRILPDEIYNLAAQSHVHVSFEVPEYTSDVTAIGTLRILDTLKTIIKKKKIKFYQAGSSEMYGRTKSKIQNENTNFYPTSPYAISKLYSYWVTRNYRESYNLFAANGILFNHESPLRGETFVTKKIVSALVRISLNKQKKLYLGNLYSKRDWGHAKDYVRAIWMILQQKKPDDFVIATGKNKTIKEFINIVCNKLKLKIYWKGKGINEKAILRSSNKIIIECNKKYLRPSEVPFLLGDFSKAKKVLKWKPKISLNQMIDEMIEYEKQEISR